jgi:exodeoxyribonuclease-1
MKSQQPTFYWHDYETWGLSPSLDRPSQFAGIRTDMDFNVLNEPDMFYCRLSDDYLPNPEPAIITQITPDITQAEGLLEFEFANRINHQFSQTNTCVVGYNTIRFDEEFSRNLFYRNFFDPYEYTWKNSSSRWDIIDLVRATYALRPDGIEWPKNEQGLPSFRLELLTQANGISHEHAHDVTSDVFATIAIAKLIKQKAPKLFNYYFELRNKNKVKALIDIDQLTPLVHVSGMFGSARGNTSLVAPIVWHPTNTNAVAVVDLMQDPSPLLELSADEIRERLYTKRDELGDKLPIPLKLVHINKCPFLAIEKTLLAENAERLAIDRQTCLDNLNILKNHPQLADIILEVFSTDRVFDNKGNVDAMLYDRFFSYDDKREFNKIHKASPEKLASLNLSVSDKRFEDLFFRYRARNFPKTLTNDEQKQWTDHCQSVLVPAVSDYFTKLDSFSEQYKGDEKNLKIITSLRKYAKKTLNL